MRNIYRKLLVLMVAVVAALPACADDGQTFFGFQIDELLKSDDHSYKFGFVKFNTSDTTNVEIVKDAGDVYSPLMSAGEYFDGKIYCYMFKWDEFFEEQYAYSYDVYDAKTFERLSRVSKSYGRRVLDMTYDHTTNTMYAIAEDEDGRTDTETGATSLYIVDMSNGNLTRVGSAGNLVGINGYGKRVSDNLVNIAADKDGNLYAMTEYRHFYSVNKFTGKATEIGKEHKLAVQPTYQSMTFGQDGVLYWTQSTPHPYGWLTTIDPVTGVPTKVGTLGRNAHIVGLFQIHDDKTHFPLAVTGLKAEGNKEGINTVRLNWTNPTKNYDGTDAAIKAIYVYRLGTEEPIAKLSADATTFLDEHSGNGDNSYEVVAVGDEAPGVPATVTVFAGYDQLKPVNDVMTDFDGKTVTLTWTRPTATVNGKWADYDNITYNVYRVDLMSGKYVRVSENQAETKYTEDILESGVFCYVIEPVCGGVVGLAAQSSDVTVAGSYTIPYTTGFEDDEDGLYWTIKNKTENKFNYGWSIAKPYSPLSGKAAILYKGGTSVECDDWLISPAIKIEPGTYKLFYNASGSSYAVYNWETCIGIDPDDVSTFTLNLDKHESASVKDWTQFEATFTITQPHTYYLGFHGYSTDSFGKLCIDNVSIVALTDGVDNISAAKGGITFAGDVATVSSDKQVVAWSVVDVAGQTVMNGQGNNSDTVQIGLTPLAAGTYIVKATLSDGKSLTAKFKK